MFLFLVLINQLAKALTPSVLNLPFASGAPESCQSGEPFGFLASVIKKSLI